MPTLIMVSFSLFIIGLAGWTITTYLVKEDSQKFIKEEVTNLLDICKTFFLSLKSLTGVLAKYSFSSHSIKTDPIESYELEENLPEVVDPIEAVETTGTIPSVESVEEDNALASFSPELIEVISEEEDKVA